MTQVLEIGTNYNYGLENAVSPRLNTAPALAYHRLVLVSAHPLFLVGLRTELSRYAEFKIIGEVSSASAALDLAASSPVGLIIVDQVRPGGALPVLQTLQRKLNGRVPVVVLGSNESEAQVAQLQQAGATRYASKTLDGAALYQVLKQALQGRRPLPGIRTLATDDGWARPAAAPVNRAQPQPRRVLDTPLSPREIQILQVIAQGCSNKEVAQILCISSHTLKNHLNNIFKKLEVEDRTQALMLSVRNGWVTL